MATKSSVAGVKFAPFAPISLVFSNELYGTKFDCKPQAWDEWLVISRLITFRIGAGRAKIMFLI